MGQSFFRDAIRDDGTPITVEVEVLGWGSPGDGLMDPGDGPEVQIADAWLKADEDRPDAPSITLTDEERWRIEEAFLADPPEQDSGEDFI